jgi:hypothetical protein
MVKISSPRPEAERRADSSKCAGGGIPQGGGPSMEGEAIAFDETGALSAPSPAHRRCTFPGRSAARSPCGVVRCRPGIVPGSEPSPSRFSRGRGVERSRISGAPLRKGSALHRVREKHKGLDPHTAAEERRRASLMAGRLNNDAYKAARSRAAGSPRTAPGRCTPSWGPRAWRAGCRPSPRRARGACGACRRCRPAARR